MQPEREREGGREGREGGRATELILLYLREGGRATELILLYLSNKIF